MHNKGYVLAAFEKARVSQSQPNNLKILQIKREINPFHGNFQHHTIHTTKGSPGLPLWVLYRLCKSLGSGVPNPYPILDHEQLNFATLFWTRRQQPLMLSQTNYIPCRHFITIEVQHTTTKQESYKVTSEFQLLMYKPG